MTKEKKTPSIRAIEIRELIIALAMFAVTVAVIYVLMLVLPAPGAFTPPIVEGSGNGLLVDDDDDGADGDKQLTNDDNGTEDGTTNTGVNGTENGSGQGNGGGSGNSGGDPNAGKTWHPPWDEQVLVTAAWTETINHPAVYTTVNHPEVAHWGNRCNTCGAEISGFAAQHLEESLYCESYTNNYKFIDSPAWIEQVLVTPAWTETINHPAIYRTIHHEGYWE